MSFSPAQWLSFVVVDIIARAFVFVAMTFNPLVALLALVVSVMHLALLGLSNCAVALLHLRPRASSIATIAVANVLFAVVFVTVWVSLIESGKQSACVGVDFKCDWKDGVITWLGVQAIAKQSLIQIVVNAVPLLIVCGISGRQNETVS
jgi:hypothetical protein